MVLSKLINGVKKIMSKLFKSKFLLGVLAVVAFVVLAGSAYAADGSITMTLKKGMKNVQVKYLQQMLNEKGFTVATSGVGSAGKESTTFGPATVSAVKKFQAANALTADGVFGAKSRAVLSGSVVVTTPSNCPAGASFNPTTGAPCTGVVTTPTTGPVSVMLSNDNPAAGTIIAGQANADLMHVTFTGSGVVNSITLTRGGVSDQSTLTNVYLYDGATRLTDGYTFNNTGTLTMNNVNLAVSGSKTVSVKADVWSSSVSYNINVALTSYTVAGGTAVASSIKGNDMYIASGTGILATANLTTTAPYPAATTINAGTTNQTLWSNTVNIGLHASTLKGLTVKMIGSAPTSSVANVALFVDGVKTVNSTINGNSQFVFDLTSAPYALTTGSHVLDVRGDVVGGAYRNFYLSLEKSADLLILDPQTSNVAVNPTYLGAQLSNVLGGLVNVAQGTLTINQDTAFNSTTTLVGGATNVKMAAFKFTSYGEDVKVNTLTFTPTFTGLTAASGTTTKIINVGLYVNGGQVGSNQTATTATPLVFNSLGSNLTIATGSSAVVELRGDVMNDTNVNYTAGTVKFDLAAGTTNAQGVTSGQLTSTSSAGGQTLTVASTNVTFAQTSGWATSTVAPNQTAKKIGSFTLQTGSAESVTINNILVGINPTVSATATATVAGGVVTGYTVTAGGTGYTSAPTVTVIGTGCAATPLATATVAGGAVTAIAISGGNNGTSGCTAATVVVAGSMLAANQITNVKVMDGSTVLGTPIGNPTSSNNFSVTLPVGISTTKTLDVYADIGSSAATYEVIPSMTITYRGDTSRVTTTSSSVAGSAIVANVATVVAGGVTFVPSSSMVAQFVIGGTSNLAIGTFNVKSNNSVGGAVLKDMVVTVPANTIGSVTVNGVTASVVGTTATLYSVNITVPADASGVNIPMTASLVCVNASGGCSGVSNSNVTAQITSLTYNDGSVVQTITPTAITATSALVASKPTLALSSSSGTGLTSGNIQIGTFTISADAAGDIKVQEVPVSINISGAATITLNTVDLRDSTGNTVIVGSGGVNGTTTLGTGGSAATASGTFVFSTPRTITKGTSETYTVYATFGGVTGGSNTMNVSFGLGAKASFKWTDVIGNVAGITGSLLNTYPSATQTKSN